MKNIFFPDNNRGQSTVEYLVVTSCLIFILLGFPPVYKEFNQTLDNKYKSYCFSVAISDPPSKDFDDKIKQDAHFIDSIFSKITQFIEDMWDVWDRFVDDIKDLFK